MKPKFITIDGIEYELIPRFKKSGFALLTEIENLKITQVTPIYRECYSKLRIDIVSTVAQNIPLTKFNPGEIIKIIKVKDDA